MRYLRWIGTAAALGVAAWLSISWLEEAYGAGPPYYDRTTNMDKWVNPWPTLLIVDMIALLIAGALMLRHRR